MALYQKGGFPANEPAYMFYEHFPCNRQDAAMTSIARLSAKPPRETTEAAPISRVTPAAFTQPLFISSLFDTTFKPRSCPRLSNHQVLMVLCCGEDCRRKGP